MKVGVFLNQDGAADYYRARLPMMTATKNKELTHHTMWLSNLLYEASERPLNFMKQMDSDIFLLQRVAGSVLIDKMKSFIKEIGGRAKIIMDHDDNAFSVSPFSNHYVDYGTQNAKIFHGGKVIYEWKDGVNLDIKENQRKIDEIKRTIEKSDLVTVTTDKLANAFRPYNDNVKILPNCVDLNEWNKLNIVRKNPDEIRICWMGGHSHWEDLYTIREPLIEIGKKHPNVKIVMVGYMPVSMEKDFREGQIEFHEWVETPAHPYRLAGLDIDIALIPLKPTVFSEGKSPIKWIEFSALGIPSVVSYVSPYSEVENMEEGDKGIFVEANDPHNWVRGIEILINSKTLRDTLGAKARDFVKKHFDINTQYIQWVNVFKEVLNANSRKPSLI